VPNIFHNVLEFVKPLPIVFLSDLSLAHVLEDEDVITMVKK